MSYWGTILCFAISFDLYLGPVGSFVVLYFSFFHAVISVLVGAESAAACVDPHK